MWRLLCRLDEKGGQRNGMVEGEGCQSMGR